MHYNIGSSTILIESQKIRNNSRITATNSSNLYEKYECELWILCFIAFLEALLQGMAKKPYWKTNQCRNSGNNEASTNIKTHRRENVVYPYKLQR